MVFEKSYQIIEKSVAKVLPFKNNFEYNLCSTVQVLQRNTLGTGLNVTNFDK